MNTTQDYPYIVMNGYGALSWHRSAKAALRACRRSCEISWRGDKEERELRAAEERQTLLAAGKMAMKVPVTKITRRTANSIACEIQYKKRPMDKLIGLKIVHGF